MTKYVTSSPNIVWLINDTMTEAAEKPRYFLKKNSKANIYLDVFINKIDDFETFKKNVKFSQFIKIQYGRRISGIYAEKLLLH